MTATAYGQSHINCTLRGLNYHECVSLLRQGCLLAMRINDVTNTYNRSSPVPASAIPDTIIIKCSFSLLNPQSRIADMLNDEITSMYGINYLLIVCMLVALICS